MKAALAVIYMSIAMKLRRSLKFECSQWVGAERLLFIFI